MWNYTLSSFQHVNLCQSSTTVKLSSSPYSNLSGAPWAQSFDLLRYSASNDHARTQPLIYDLKLWPPSFMRE